MASVDLYGNDAQRIRSRYKTSLQRDASDDEVSGWLSGAYGGGGVDAWENQIASSDEARQRGTYKPPTQTPPATTTPPVVGQPPPGVSGPQVSSGAPTGGSQAAPDPSAAMQRLQDAYQKYLGRSASNDELNNWLTGKYGYGSGAGSVGAFESAIATSGEAKAYRPAGAGSTYRDIDYWQKQGVGTDQIFDTTTGQVKPGWARTANGYERTGGTTGTTGGTNQPPPGGYQTYVQNLFNGKTPSPQVLESMAGELAKYGIKLGPRNASGFIDTIILPDGTRWDIIESATADGGKRWQWIPAGKGGPDVSTPGVTGVNVPGTQYSDPYTKLLEEMMLSRINELLQGVNDPSRQQYADSLQKRGDALGQAEPQYQQLMDFLQQRFTDLQKPAYTGAENEVLRTQALDPIERDRAAARQRATERLAARGLNLESGIAQAALNDVDKAFDAMRAQNQGQLAQNELMRREDRSQRAGTIGGQLVDIPQARAREQLDVFDALQLLSSSVRGEEEARRREAIGYGGALADLGPQRLQLAMQAAGMGGTPGSAVSSLLGVNSMMNQNTAMNTAQSNNRWSGIGSMLAILSRAGL